MDDYSTGAGLGLTLSSNFAALLKGSVILVDSQLGHGSHFRATFQGVELTYPDPSLLAHPVVPQLPIMSKVFHTIPSSSEASSLCNHFAAFVTCYGFSSSNSIDDTLVILDYPIDTDKRVSA